MSDAAEVLFPGVVKWVPLSVSTVWIVYLDPAQILSAVEQIVEKTGDLDYATASLKTRGYVIQATGAEGVHVGALISEFKKLGIEGEAGILQAMDTLVTQGKAGALGGRPISVIVMNWPAGGLGAP